jgi:beta-glucosidase-like glycosyl hydrolase
MNAFRLIYILIGTGLTASALHPTAATAAEPTAGLGRLFMTPEWRASLERQRQFNIREARSLEGGAMRLDGVVLRSSGKATVWVNNRPQTESSRDTGVLVAPSQGKHGRATLITGEETPANLAVGETINRATRETAGGLAGGEIRVHRPAPQR